MTIYRGLVTRVTDEGAFVEVPKLGVGVEYGPCEVYSPAVALSALDAEPYTEVSSDSLAASTVSTWRTHGHSDAGTTELAQHRHRLRTGEPGVQPGSAVLVTDIAEVKDDLAVIAVLR